MKMTRSEALTALGLPTGSLPTIDALKKAYRRKAMEHHPDRGGNAETFKKVNGANTMLTDLINKGYSKDEASSSSGSSWTKSNSSTSSSSSNSQSNSDWYSKWQREQEASKEQARKDAQRERDERARKAREDAVRRETALEKVISDLSNVKFYSKQAERFVSDVVGEAMCSQDDYETEYYFDTLSGLNKAATGAAKHGVDFIFRDPYDGIVLKDLRYMLDGEIGQLFITVPVEERLYDSSLLEFFEVSGEAHGKCPHCIGGEIYERDSKYGKPIYKGRCTHCDGKGNIKVTIRKNLLDIKPFVKTDAQFVYFMEQDVGGKKVTYIVMMTFKLAANPFKPIDLPSDGRDARIMAFTDLKTIIKGGEATFEYGGTKYVVKLTPYTQAHQKYRLKGKAKSGGDLYVSFVPKIEESKEMESMFS